MTLSLKHTFQSGIADSGDSSVVQPSNWNAEHTILMATNKLLGRTTASTGAVEEIGAGTGLTLSGGSLTTDSTVVRLGVATVYTAQQNFGTATLTDAATISWDVATAQVAKVTLGDNRTLGAPTNLVDGGTYILRVIQDGTGSRTLAYNAVFKWPGGTTPTLSTAASAIDILTFISDGTNMYGVAQKAFA